MSLALAKIWVEATLSLPEAQTDACEQLDNANTAGVEATFLLGPGLTTNGKSYLARWTDVELLVYELTELQQQSFGVTPHKMLCHCALPSSLEEHRPDFQLTLSDVELGGPRAHSGSQPLMGTCSYHSDSLTIPERKWALRIKYFRPDSKGTITQFWHPPEPYAARSAGSWSFSFPPLNAPDSEVSYSGSVAAYMQIMTAESWQSPVRGLRRISNNVATILEVIR